MSPNVDVITLPSTTGYVNINVANVLTSHHVEPKPKLQKKNKKNKKNVFPFTGISDTGRGDSSLSLSPLSLPPTSLRPCD
jgi:hypothetical protein